MELDELAEIGIALLVLVLLAYVVWELRRIKTALEQLKAERKAVSSAPSQMTMEVNGKGCFGLHPLVCWGLMLFVASAV